MCVFIFSFIIEVEISSLGASTFRVSCLLGAFFFCINIPVMCQANKTQRIPLQGPASSSGEVLAVCGVNNTVWCALEVTI